MQYLLFFLCGSLGAFVKDIVKDGYIELPHISEKKLFLGFIGSALIGGFVGMLIDGSYIVACLGGYVGYSVIENVLAKNIVLPKEK